MPITSHDTRSSYCATTLLGQNVGARRVEGSGVQGEEDESDMDETLEKKVERLTSEGDMRCNVFIN